MAANELCDHPVWTVLQPIACNTRVNSAQSVYEDQDSLHSKYYYPK